MRWIAVVTLSVMLAACAPISPSVNAPGTRRTDQLVIGQGREFNSLLPYENNGFTASELIGLAFSLLVTLGPRGEVPDATLSVPDVRNGGISRDGRTITYHLRRGMRWQDGVPLTARDVLFTHNFVMSPRSLFPFRDGFDRVAAIAAPDAYTVVVRLKRPYRSFVTNFLGPESPTGILPEHLLAKLADVTHSAYAARPVGSGPYRIGSWHHGDSIVFDADPQWYRGKPKIARIVVRFIPDATTRLTQLRTHEIDAELGASAKTAAELRNVPGLRLDVETGPLFTQITFNLKESIVAQAAVRRAIVQSIDTETIARKISYGFFNGRDGGRGLYLWAYDEHAGYPRFDARAAQRQLDAAGWRRDTDGMRRDAAGRRLAFTLSLRADKFDDIAAAVQVQAQLRLAGIDVALKTYSAPQFTANDGVIRTGRFTAILNNYYPYIDPDPTIFLACADRGRDGFNVGSYCDPAADADMYAALETFDRSTVRRYLSRVQRRINRALPMFALWQGVDINIVPAGLQNFSDLLGEPFSNVGTWSLRPR